MSNEAYIYDAVRTPRGRGKKGSGSLYEVKPIDLLVNLFQALEKRNNLDTSKVEDVVLGCVTPIGNQGGNIAKLAPQYAGWDISVPGFQLNRFCASGLEAANLAAMKVRSGWQHLIVAGGVESMSRVPMGMDGGAWVMDPAVNSHTDFVPQGISADLIASLEGFSRTDCDEYAVQSQKRAKHAWDNNYFEKSIVPVEDQNGLTILDYDEFMRPGTTVEILSGLKPSFQSMGEMGFDAVALKKYPQLESINHVHTPGNSSGIVDGAALVLIGSKEVGEQLGLTPRAKIVTAAVTSSDATIMLTGPGYSSKMALEQAGMTIDDIDLVEMNEAFSSAVLRLQKRSKCPQ